MVAMEIPTQVLSSPNLFTQAAEHIPLQVGSFRQRGLQVALGKPGLPKPFT